MAGGDYGGYAFKNGVRVAIKGYHSQLGTKKLLLCLEKQWCVHVFSGRKALFTLMHNVYPAKRSGVEVRVKHHNIRVRWEETDNLYQYVRLREPDGTIWLGFSGYGVGDGFEDGSYGFDTEKCVKRLFKIFGKE